MHRVMLAGAAALALAASAAADLDTHAAVSAAADHAPIAVMGDHVHGRGEVMVSYRYMRMDMEGNRIGTDDVSPEEIVSETANFLGAPPTLRVAPTEMTMDMHMFGAMYGLTDEVTLMAMVPYVVKEMDHVTFQGAAGTTRLGEFTTKSSGLGDVKLSALAQIAGDETSRLVVQGGFSLPTGSIEEEDEVLTPMNARPTLRLPYAMQLGSGTVDPMASVTYARTGRVGWGAQASAVVRVAENGEDYALGDEYRATAWGSFAFSPAASVSARVAAQSIGEIEGGDAAITAPVQTANPEFYGGERVDIALGVNLIGRSGPVAGHRLALEAAVPVHQDLNGPQMETDWVATLGWQYAWGG
ncbi:MAG: transporter [Caulobacterales bacterium]|nr:transporter [Caulobacterales bacterium]